MANITVNIMASTMDMRIIISYGYEGGIVLWNGKQKEPEKNSKAQYYLKDGRLLQHESTWIFER